MSNLPNIRRLTMRDVFRSIADVFNFHHGILRTILDLAIRPKSFFQRYFFVERSCYTHPVTLLLLMLAGVIFLYSHLLPIRNTYSPNVILTMTATNDAELATISFLREYDNAFRLMWVPITSALSLFFFRKQAWYFAEHLAFNAYILAFQFLLMIVLFPMSMRGMEWIAGAAFMCFFVYTYTRCMEGHWVATLAKSFAVMIISSLTFAGLIYVVGMFIG